MAKNEGFGGEKGGTKVETDAVGIKDRIGSRIAKNPGDFGSFGPTGMAESCGVGRKKKGEEGEGLAGGGCVAEREGGRRGVAGPTR